MSDPLAVSILAKLTSWYPLEGDMTDAHGPNDLVTSVVEAYEAGKVDNQLSIGSKGGCTLADAIPFTTASASLTIGGWVRYVGSVANHAHFGLAGATYESFTMSSGANFLKAFGWEDAGVTDYLVGTATGAGQAYPLRFRVTDSQGTQATSDQILIVADANGDLPHAWYFAVATWENGNMKMYVDSVLVATATPPASVVNASLTRFQIGNTINGNLSVAGLDEVFFCDAAVMTADEIAWLYNLGSGRAYADIVTEAA